MKKLFWASIIIIFSGNIFLAGQGIALGVQTPKTLEEAETLGKEMTKEAPGVFGKVWQEALGVWSYISQKARSIFNSYIKPPVLNIWNRAKDILNLEVEKRKPGVETELEKEKNELKEELPKAGKSLWEKIKSIIMWWKR